MEFARARFRDDVDERAGVAPVLGLVVVHQHLHFGDRIHAGRAVEPVDEVGVASGLTVEREGVHPVARPADVGSRGAERVAERRVVRACAYARHDAEQRHDVTALRPELLDLTRRQQLRVLRARRLHRHRLSAHRDHFGQRRHAQRDVAERAALVRREDDARTLGRIEASELHLHGVCARHQRGEHEVAGRIGRRHPHIAGSLVAQRDGRADEHLARCIQGRPADLTARRLPGSESGQRAEQPGRAQSPYCA